MLDPIEYSHDLAMRIIYIGASCKTPEQKQHFSNWFWHKCGLTKEAKEGVVSLACHLDYPTPFYGV